MYSFLILLFFIVVVIQVGYYGLLLSRFSTKKAPKSNQQNYPVSIIVACRNEAENLRKYLPKLLKQQYHKFEIILVDDASQDETLSVMEQYAKKDEKVNYFSIPKTENYTGNKKNAITLAIQKASNEHLLFIDADCEPKSDNWVAKMSINFSKKKQLILGYGAYKKSSGWLNKLIRFETLITASQYFSYAIAGIPYMGVGRNMAYTKSFFSKANGFRNHENIKSGDDDLIINQMATTENTAICWEKETHTISQPKTTFGDWFRQKRRHITTATSYKPIHQLLLGLFYVSQLLFYVLFVLLLILGYKITLLLFLFGIRYYFYFIVMYFSAKKLNEKDLILWLPFLEFFLVVAQLCIFISNLVRKPTNW